MDRIDRVLLRWIAACAAMTVLAIAWVATAEAAGRDGHIQWHAANWYYADANSAQPA